MKFETSDQLSFLLPNVYPGNGNVEQLKCVQDLDETHLFVSTEVVEQLKVHLRTFKAAFRIRIQPDPLHLAGSGSTSNPAPDPDPDPDQLRCLSSDHFYLSGKIWKKGTRIRIRIPVKMRWIRNADLKVSVC